MTHIDPDESYKLFLAGKLDHTRVVTGVTALPYLDVNDDEHLIRVPPDTTVGEAQNFWRANMELVLRIKHMEILIVNLMNGITGDDPDFKLASVADLRREYEAILKRTMESEHE